MRTVYKYPFGNIWDTLVIPVPLDHEVVHVGYQQEVLTAWVELDPNQPKVNELHLTVHGTGHPITDKDAQHVATVFSGNLVWHVYGKEMC